MITNFVRSNNRNIDTKIKKEISEMPKNIPCKVDLVNPDMTVNVTSLIDNVHYFNINVLLPIGISYDLYRLKYGILYYCDYDFSSLLETGELLFKLESNQTQFGVFIPILDVSNLNIYSSFNQIGKGITIFNDKGTNYISVEDNDIIIDNNKKASITMENGSLSISNNLDFNSIKMTDSELNIKSSAPISISTDTSSLYEILNDILEMLTKMNADTVAGNGAPLASPTLTAELPVIITKLQGVLK